EGERRAAFELQWLASVVRENEDGVVDRRLLPPPAGPGGVGIPRPGVTAEHVAPHDRRTEVGQRLLDHRGARGDRATLEAVRLAPDRQRERPVVELHPAQAERVGDALVRARDVAVEGHRDREPQPRHRGEPPQVGPPFHGRKTLRAAVSKAQAISTLPRPSVSSMSSRKLIARLVVQTGAWLGFMGLLLFVAAGDWRWTQAWAFLAIFALGSVAFSVWLLPRDPALLESRLGPFVQRGQPWWDRIFLPTFLAVLCGWVLVLALDARRAHSARRSP